MYFTWIIIAASSMSRPVRVLYFFFFFFFALAPSRPVNWKFVRVAYPLCEHSRECWEASPDEPDERKGWQRREERTFIHIHVTSRTSDGYIPLLKATSFCAAIYSLLSFFFFYSLWRALSLSLSIYLFLSIGSISLSHSVLLCIVYYM